MKNQITRIAKDKNSFIGIKTSHKSSSSLSNHKHEDFELMLISDGKEQLYVNGVVIEMSPGDAIFLGGGVMHQKLQANKVCELATWQLLFFPKSIFPKDIDLLPDYLHIASLLEKSRYGLLFRGDESYDRINTTIKLIDESSGIKRISLLLELLEWMSQYPYKVLSTKKGIDSLTYQEASEPVLKVMNYIEKHYKETINLQFLSNLVGMSKFSLCKHFKLKTGLTIQQFIQSLRIEAACRLIVSKKFTISEIATKVGYQNISVFNQHFKRIVHKTPSQFRTLV